MVVGVAVADAAAVDDHAVVEDRRVFAVLGVLEFVEKVGELFEVEGVDLGDLGLFFGVVAVVADFVVAVGDAEPVVGAV